MGLISVKARFGLAISDGFFVVNSLFESVVVNDESLDAKRRNSNGLNNRLVNFKVIRIYDKKHIQINMMDEYHSTKDRFFYSFHIIVDNHKKNTFYQTNKNYTSKQKRINVFKELEEFKKRQKD